MNKKDKTNLFFKYYGRKLFTSTFMHF